MSFEHCPGIKRIIGPVQIVTRTCPSCGEEVEFFSDETDMKCPGCGRTLHREATPSCVAWCEYAIKCIDDLRDRGLVSLSRARELESMAKNRRGRSSD